MASSARLATLIALSCSLPITAYGASVTLSGTIRDFCAPGISGTCTQLSDFEGAVPGVVTNMTATTLSGGLPAPGPNLVAGASNPTNFARWYVGSPGFNLSAPFSLTLTEGPPGVFTYSDSTFFPIDGQLFGNQGRSNNYHFTVHLEGLLSFADPTPGADFSFSFTGDDDLWIFVNGTRFIDLGGVHGAATGSFTEETLKAAGLTAGTPYDLDIFFAERHTTASTFSITTSLAVAPPVTPAIPEPATLALFAMGAAALGAMRVRRRDGGRA